jgi:hypothetical protein
MPLLMPYLCRLLVNTGCAGLTSMVMHAQSHAQALLAAKELFPSCQVDVVALNGPGIHPAIQQANQGEDPRT